MKLKRMIAGMIVVSAFFGVSLNGQDRNEVIQAYNEGAKAIQTDVPAAIAAFEKVIDLSAQVGETADDLKEKAVGVLPGLYYKLAAAAYRPAGMPLQSPKNITMTGTRKTSTKYLSRVTTGWPLTSFQQMITKMPYWHLTACWS